MNTEFIQWLLGFAFGLIAGYIITATYYWNKMRQLRLKLLVTQVDEVKGLLNKALHKNKKIRASTELEERVWQTYQNAQGTAKQYSRVAEACGLYMRNNHPNKMKVWRIIKKRLKQNG
jgi:hypothetical protein